MFPSALHIHQRDFTVVDPVLLTEYRQPFDQFSHELDAGESTACDSEGEHLPAKNRILFVACFADDLDDVILDPQGILKGPEVERVLLDSGEY